MLARAIWASLVVYLSILAFREAIDPQKTRDLSLVAARTLIIDTLPWFGGIFAASYVSLYARFSSQWLYLAGVYNQIKAAEVRMHERGDPTNGALAALSHWKAGFVEDADDLHLATKPLFATVILHWLEDPAVADSFRAHAVNGPKRLDQILAATRDYSKRHERELGGEQEA